MSTNPVVAALVVGLLFMGFTVGPLSVGGAAPADTSTPPGATVVDSCGTLDRPGTYALASDVVADGDGDGHECLTVTADGVVLDGGGHQLVGSESATGIFVQADDVVVRNLTLTGWRYAVSTTGSDGLRLVGVDATANRHGLYGWASTDVELVDSRFADSLEDGVELVDVDGVTLTRVVSEHNGNYGLVLTGVTDVRITEGVYSSNGDAGVRLADASPVSLSRVAVTGNLIGVDGWRLADARVTDSTLTGNRGVALALDRSSDVTLTGVVVAETSGRGVDVRRSAGVVVADSRVADNVGAGLTVESSTRTQVLDSVLAGNQVGLALDSGWSLTTNTTVVGNRIADNDVAGIVVTRGATDGQFTGNYFSNRVNVVVDPRAGVEGGSLDNVWGVSPAAGNYYAAPGGSGFSQHCTDRDGDGSCDLPMVHGPDNVDRYALSSPAPLEGFAGSVVVDDTGNDSSE